MWLSGCGAFAPPSDPSSAKPPDFDPVGGQAKCRVSGSQKRPLIVEWSAADRAALEVLAQRGTVVVRYSGCEMEILPRCRAPGSYQYAPTTRKSEQVIIRDADELYANLPMGAVKLEGKLARSGQLNVVMNVVGQYGWDQDGLSAAQLEGECDKATHVVSGLTVGAFEFSAGGAAEAGGGVGVVGVGAGASTTHSRDTISSDGDVEACAKATREDVQPPTGCGALLRIEVADLQKAGVVAGAAAPQACPAGAQAVNGVCVPVSVAINGVEVASRLLVRVSCGTMPTLLGESDGLEVWIDGVKTPAADELRTLDPMSPGKPGPVQFVAYPVEPGEHHVRIAATDCAEEQRDVKVAAGQPREIGGRLEPTAWYQRPPAASWSFGIALNYDILDFESLTVEDSDYNALPVELDKVKGFGVEIPLTAQYAWMAFGFDWGKGDASFIARDCSYGDCVPAGTKVDAEFKLYRIPYLAGARLPFGYGAALLGTGFEMDIIKLDAGKASGNVSSTGDLGFHVPVILGLEARPFCQLALTARGSRGFSLSDAMSNYYGATVSLAYLGSVACSGDDFGIQ